jgi:hypothetical protein
MESPSGEVGRQIPCAVRRRQPGHGANTAQQFAGREHQFTATQLLHAAPPPGRFVLGITSVFHEPSALHAQPTCRTQRQKPARIDDRPRPSALVDAAGPRANSAPVRLTRGSRRLPTEPPSTRNPALTDRPLPCDLCDPKTADSEPRRRQHILAHLRPSICFRRHGAPRISFLFLAAELSVGRRRIRTPE